MAMPARHEIIEFLRTEIENRADLADTELSNDAPLSTLGLSSLDVVLISGALEDRFDLDIDPTMMYEFPTIHAVADRLVETGRAV